MAPPKEDMSKTITLITIEVIGPKRSSALSAVIARLQALANGLWRVRGVEQVSVSIAQNPMDESQESIRSESTQH